MNRVVTRKLLASLLALLAAGCGGGDDGAGHETTTSTSSETTTSTSSETATWAPPGTTQPQPVSIDEGFNLVGVYGSEPNTWTLALIDPATGQETVRANLPGVSGWTWGMRLDDDASHAYVVNEYTLWVVDLAAGTTTTTQLGARSWLGGVADDGRAITMTWTDAVELEIRLVDPSTGTATSLGVVDDIDVWLGQVTYDRGQGILYFIAADAGGAKRLFAFSLDTQTTTSVPIDKKYLVAGVEPSGHILAASREAPNWPESYTNVVRIDPSTGGVAVLGLLGDMTDGTFTYDRTRNRVLASGAKPTSTLGQMWTYGPDSIYSFDLGTLQTSKVEQVHLTNQAYFLVKP